MELRGYQIEAVNAVWEHLRTRNDSPAIVLPTGSGKTPAIAELCRQAVKNWNGRVLVLSHSRELIAQSAEKLQMFLPSAHVGVYSAGLKRRDLNHSVISAGIQSVYRKACSLGPFNLIIVDEAQLLPPEGEGMYRTFLSHARIINPQVRLVGATATPYRLGSGNLCGPDKLLNHVCYEVGVRDLIEQGYLSPLISRAGVKKADVSGLHLRGGEFIADEVESLMNADDLVKSAVAEIVGATRDRKSCLIFCAGVKHAEHVARVFREEHGLECGIVEGNTPVSQRAELIARFKGEAAPATLFGKSRERLKYLANVAVLGIGFDAPAIDCVVLLRPTASAGLFYQQCGRAFRLAPGKTDALILDFANNIVRHGPVDILKAGDRPRAKGSGECPAKECSICRTVVHASLMTCPECGHIFPASDKPKHNAHASEAPVISNATAAAEPRDLEVTDVVYSVHNKRGAPPGHPPSMRVSYETADGGAFYSEYVCPQHSGYARDKFLDWWRKRSHYSPPRTVAEAVRMAREGCLAPTKGIRVKTDDNGYEKIAAYSLGEKPEVDSDLINALRDAEGEPAAVQASNDSFSYDEDEIPF